MYFCYNLEKEEGSLKTELKNCLSLYKIFYSCAFILIPAGVERQYLQHDTLPLGQPDPAHRRRDPRLCDDTGADPAYRGPQ